MKNRCLALLAALYCCVEGSEVRGPWAVRVGGVEISEYELNRNFKREVLPDYLRAGESPSEGVVWDWLERFFDRCHLLAKASEAGYRRDYGVEMEVSHMERHMLIGSSEEIRERLLATGGVAGDREPMYLVSYFVFSDPSEVEVLARPDGIPRSGAAFHQLGSELGVDEYSLFRSNVSLMSSEELKPHREAVQALARGEVSELLPGPRGAVLVLVEDVLEASALEKVRAALLQVIPEDVGEFRLAWEAALESEARIALHEETEVALAAWLESGRRPLLELRSLEDASSRELLGRPFLRYAFGGEIREASVGEWLGWLAKTVVRSKVQSAPQLRRAAVRSAIERNAFRCTHLLGVPEMPSFQLDRRNHKNAVAVAHYELEVLQPQIDVSEPALRIYYQGHLADFQEGAEVVGDFYRFASSNEARGGYATIRAAVGVGSSDKLDRSDLPGLLGVDRGIVFSFEEADLVQVKYRRIFRMREGVCSPPYEDGDAFVVFHKIRESGVRQLSFEAAREDVLRALKKERLEALRNQAIAKARAKYSLEFNLEAELEGYGALAGESN